MQKTDVRNITMAAVKLLCAVTCSLIPRTAPSKVWVYGPSLVGTGCSNPGGGMNVCVLCVLCVVR